MRVDVTSMMLMANFAVPELARRGGAIVNIASAGGLIGMAPNLVCGTFKGALVNLALTTALNHGGQGIRVNCVAPGMVNSPAAELGGLTEEQRQARRRLRFLGTDGTGWDVGYAVLFLASDEARWITGVVLPVDGGLTAGAMLG